MLVLALVALAVAAGAAHAGGGPGPKGAYVSPDLLAAAQANPQQVFNIILQGNPKGGNANSVANDVNNNSNGSDNGNAIGLRRQLATVNGAAAQVTGKVLLKLAKQPDIAAITSDDPVHLTGGISNTQQWPYVTDVFKGWSSITNGKLPPLPAIAVVDSGVDVSRSDFGGRVLTQQTITNLPGTIPNGDAYGHGTFVAGIAAGSAPSYAGAAPSAPIVSLDVMDNNGMALTSDVIAAADWIIQNKAKYNIGVANFSLHSTAPASVFWDPLDRAVEDLWMDGVVVVAAAGNYGVSGKPSGVLYAPGNDPFVITVGADDSSGSVSTKDDAAAPWSAWGYTYDGFSKPDLAAPGRYMIGPVPPSSTLAQTRASSMVAPGYIQLSGTSFAAPIVAGAAAYILALHPTWTPDQVKGALMLTAKPAGDAVAQSEGVGVIDTAAAVGVTNPPNPNLALDQFVGADPNGGSIPVFNSSAWRSAALANASWSDASWSDASWSDASWASASWSDSSWATASWSDASWSDSSMAQILASASWGDAAGNAATQADNAGADAGAPDQLSPADAAALGIHP